MNICDIVMGEPPRVWLGLAFL